MVLQPQVGQRAEVSYHTASKQCLYSLWKIGLYLPANRSGQRYHTHSNSVLLRKICAKICASRAEREGIKQVFKFCYQQDCSAMVQQVILLHKEVK